MTGNLSVFAFNSAIVRRPGKSVVRGLRADDRGNPSYEGILTEHDAYVAALKDAGVEVQILEPLEDFPDSIFVEDPALVFTEGAILLNPGVPSRAGETAAIAPVLRDRFETVLPLTGGYVDGGDVLSTPDSVMIGLSARTNLEGANALIGCLAELGRKGLIVETPADVLHFKSDCSLLDNATILTTKRLSASGVFTKFRQIIVPDGEEAAANALRVNDRVFIGIDYPGTIDLLTGEGYRVICLPISEIARIDAGLSCMSLRWHA
jgi:dimethylargininase